LLLHPAHKSWYVISLENSYFSFSNDVIQSSMNNLRRILTHSSTSFTIYNSIMYVHDPHLPLSHLSYDFSIERFTKPVSSALLCLLHIYVFHKQLFNLHIIILALIYQCTTVTSSIHVFLSCQDGDILNTSYIKHSLHTWTNHKTFHLHFMIQYVF
jgi:hypothetical protein